MTTTESRQHVHLRPVRGASATLRAFIALAGMGAPACISAAPADPPAAGSDAVAQALTETKGETTPLEKLPKVDPLESTEVYIQQLSRETELGENAVIHVRLPQPHNRELSQSLVRVIGDEAQPLVLFRSDALAKLGTIERSPGEAFFSAFIRFDPAQLEQRARNTKLLDSGTFGKATDLTVIFNGRSPVAVRTGLSVDINDFKLGRFIPLGPCMLRPISNLNRWGESLLVTSPRVVLDPNRTWDPCTGAGTPGGVWTFAHLIREMAIGSGATPEGFVLAWLTRWLNDYSVNADLVQRRTQMFNQVIRPWAIASGVANPTLVQTRLGAVVNLDGGALNLDIAPFRLLAIVNRIDLGRTASGTGGYGGGTAERPLDAGELRFIFGVTQPNPWGAGTQASCGLKPFTVIFEYGVPIQGCSRVVKWAKQWTHLNTFGGFNPSYLAELQNMTESVVVHGAAPAKGNQNALNQVRTNEIALSSRWELREFTLSDEDPAAGTDTPSNGLLRPHTVAQTPDDAAFPTPDATVDDFVINDVIPSVPGSVGPLPNHCAASYEVPYSHLGNPFRGGNSLAPPGAWLVSGLSGSDAEVCGRHQFSLNTCDGCHLSETATGFTHVSPTSGIPAALSNFLTGGGPGLAFSVPDTQFGAPSWPFADLHRRFDRLYDIAFCTECGQLFPLGPELLKELVEITSVLPIDPIGPVTTDFKVGPVTDLDAVAKLLDVRGKVDVSRASALDAPVDLIGPAQVFVH